jgi:hypothetical protein
MVFGPGEGVFLMQFTIQAKDPVNKPDPAGSKKQ